MAFGFAKANTKDTTSDTTFAYSNKNAFQWDAYRPLIDRMPASASRRGMPGPGGSGSGGVWSGGGIPACTEADPPPVDRQAPVKILPWPNFVAAGNNTANKTNVPEEIAIVFTYGGVNTTLEKWYCHSYLILAKTESFNGKYCGTKNRGIIICVMNATSMCKITPLLLLYDNDNKGEFW